MGIFSLFNQTKIGLQVDLQSPYRLSIDCESFVDAKLVSIYTRILSKCLSKTRNIDSFMSSMYDNANIGHSGLITQLAQSLSDNTRIYLVYDSGIVRKATSDERKQIQSDYDNLASSRVGIIADFTQYTISKLLKCYMQMIHTILQAANTQVNLSKSLQIKIADLRKTVAAPNAEQPIEAAKRINEGLKNGKSVLLDKLDEVLQVSPQTAAIKESINLIYTEAASLLGMPVSFVSGELTSGMAVTGEADSNAEEQGIKVFWNSIFKPICDSLFNINTEFVSANWRRLAQYVNAFPYIETSEILTQEEKREFIKWSIYG